MTDISVVSGTCSDVLVYDGMCSGVMGQQRKLGWVLVGYVPAQETRMDRKSGCWCKSSLVSGANPGIGSLDGFQYVMPKQSQGRPQLNSSEPGCKYEPSIPLTGGRRLSL